METPRPAVGPDEFRRQSRLVGMIGLLMDVLVSAVLLAFQVFEQTALYILVIALIGSGVVLAYVFSVIFPNRYQRNYETKYGPKL